MTEVVDTPPRRWSGLPGWARIGLIALAAVVVALLAIVAIRLATRVPPIVPGPTAVTDLRPGSCLEESGVDLAEYTVVSCDREHPQQVFAEVDLEIDAETYSLVDTALATFGDQVCSRYLEYRLYLRDGLETRDYRAYALAVPTPGDYAAGDRMALCALAPADGGSITGDAYRPMP